MDIHLINAVNVALMNIVLANITLGRLVVGHTHFKRGILIVLFVIVVILFIDLLPVCLESKQLGSLKNQFRYQIQQSTAQW